MADFQRVINGVLVQMKSLDTRPEQSDVAFDILGDGHHLVVLTRVADDGAGHGRWLCPCGHDSGKRDPMLAHVVAEFAKVSPLLTAEKGRTFEAMNTYLRLAGKHADPTYEQAMRHMYGNPW